MNHGLSEATVTRIQSVLEQFPEVDRAILFGSRAKGCAKPGSDIDLTLTGEIDQKSVWKVADALDDLLLPYKFSLSAFASLQDRDFIAHIERVGIVFYERNQPVS